MDHNKIVNALRNVKDPKTGQDIISVGLVHDFRINGNHVGFTIKLDHNDPSIKSSLNFGCIGAIKELYPEAEVHIHLDSAKANSPSNQVLPHVKNIVAIASGKGGVGKSTITANLAMSLLDKGYKVGLMDADLYGPSMPKMFGIEGQRPPIKELYGKHKIVPIQTNGLHIVSIGNIVDPEQAVVLRGPRLGGIIKQFVNECIWPELDFLLIDLPPGTGDIQLTLVQTVPLTGVVMVTTPQDLAFIDAVKAMNMFMLDNINVPILGVIENMSWFTPNELPDHKYHIFGQGGGRKLADKAGTMLLGHVPLIMSARENGDQGIPAFKGENQMFKDVFTDLSTNLVRQISMRNETMAPTQIVDVK